jgi:hypothetical protein
MTKHQTPQPQSSTKDMSYLREELKKRLYEKDAVITEAAFMWFEKNVVLVNEQLDRRTVKRIIDSISKFDSIFGKYKSKIPAIGDLVTAAEDELQNVLVGKSSERSASNMLKKLSYYYSTFSNFFNSDLPVLLSSHLFSAPKENPDVKINVLQPKDGMRYDPLMILNSIKHALTPNKEEAALMKKIYKKNLPLIDANSAANQMLQLSYNELNELASIGKIPIMAIPGGGQPKKEPPVAPPPSTTPEGTGLSMGESIDNGEKTIILESHRLLLELNQKQLLKVIDILNQLQSNFNIPGMETVNKSLQSLISAARKEISSNKWVQGNAVKQLVGFYNLMDNLNQQWPQIKQLFSDNTLQPNEQADLQKLLASSTEDSVFGKLAKAFKLQTPHAPGLDPNSVVKGIMAAVNQENGVKAVDSLFQKAKGMPKTDSTTGEPKVQGAPDQAGKPGETAAPDKTQKAGQTTDTETAKGSVPSSGQMDIPTMAAEIVAKNKFPKEQASSFEAFLTSLQKAGYSVSKK